MLAVLNCPWHVLAPCVAKCPVSYVDVASVTTRKMDH